MTRLQREDLMARLALFRARGVVRITIETSELEELLQAPYDLLQAAKLVRDASRKGASKIDWNAAIGYLRAVIMRYEP